MVTSSVAGMSVIDSPPRVSAIVADVELTRVLDDLDHTSIIALSEAELLDSIKAKTGLLARVQAFLNAELAEAETRGITQTVRCHHRDLVRRHDHTPSIRDRPANASTRPSTSAHPVPLPAAGPAGRPGVGRAGRRDLCRPAAPAQPTWTPKPWTGQMQQMVDVRRAPTTPPNCAGWATGSSTSSHRRSPKPTPPPTSNGIEAHARRTRQLALPRRPPRQLALPRQSSHRRRRPVRRTHPRPGAKGDNNRINTPDDDALGREERCWSAKCADALLEIIPAYQHSGKAPGLGGDRPRINVTIDLATLQGQLGHAVLGNGAPITAGEARRLACDANILPVVLDGTIRTRRRRPRPPPRHRCAPARAQRPRPRLLLSRL